MKTRTPWAVPFPVFILFFVLILMSVQVPSQIATDTIFSRSDMGLLSRNNEPFSRSDGGDGSVLHNAAFLVPQKQPRQIEEFLKDLRSSWVRLGPPGAHVAQIVFSPRSPKVIYAGLDDKQGLYRSEDNGEQWNMVSGSVRDVSTGTLAVHSADEQKILFGDSLYGKGLFKSTDGGKTWRNVGFSGRYFNFKGIAASRTDPDTVYVGLIKPLPVNSSSKLFKGSTRVIGDLYRSVDFGDSWTNISPPEPPAGVGPAKRADRNASSVQVDAKNSGIVYVGIFGAIYVTSDGGRTFERSLELPTAGAGAAAIATDPKLSGVAYVGIQRTLYKTVDAGKSWSRVDQSFPSEFEYFFILPGLIVSPHDSATLYTGAPMILPWPWAEHQKQPQGIFRSSDGGRNWQRIDKGYDNNPLMSLAQSPYDPNLLFLGTKGRGILKSTDGGINWRYVNGNLLSAWVSALALDPTDPRVIYTGISDGQAMANEECFKSNDGGLTWQYKKGKLYSVWTQWLVDPKDPQIVYGAGGHGGVEMSTDGGETWKLCNIFKSKSHNPVCIDLNRDDPRAVYAAGGGEVWKSIDKGSSWSEIIAGLSLPPHQFFWHGITVVPGPTTDPAGKLDHIYLGTRAGVFFSHDGGLTWASSGPTETNFSALAAYRSATTGQDVIYAGTGWGGFYKSINSGASWSKLSVPFRETTASAIVFHPQDPQIVFVCNSNEGHRWNEGSTPGLYVSADSGRTWTDLTPTNLPYSSIFSVAIHPMHPNIIYAATPGGILKLALPTDFYNRIK
jgi:photosystem II stability/assembly factor-like uncharacterized protein